MSRFARLAAVFACIVLGGVAQAAAQAFNPALAPDTAGDASETVQAANPEQLRELLRLLSDPGVVEALRDSLQEQEDAAADWSLRREVSAVVSRMEERIASLISGFAAIGGIPAAVALAWDSGLDPGDTLRALTYVLIFLFIGGGLEWLYFQYARPVQLRMRFGHEMAESVGDRVMRAAMRVFLHLAGLAIFAAGSAGAFLMFDWPTLTREMVISLLIAVVGFRLVGMLVMFILAPAAPDLRLVPLGNRRAKRAARYVAGATLVGAFGIVASDGLWRLGVNTGFDEELAPAATVVPVLAATLFAMILSAMVWRLRQPLADDPPERHEAPPSVHHPVIHSVMIAAVFVLWLIGAREMMWTVAILGLLYPAMRTTRAVIGNFFDQAEEAAELKAAEEADEAEADEAPAASMAEDAPPVGGDAGPLVDTSRYGTMRLVVIRLVRILLFIVAMAGIAWAWGVGLLSLSESPSAAGQLFRVVVNVGITLLIADLAWTWAKTAINRRLADYGPANDGMAPGPEARIATLLPILRMFLMVTIGVIVILTVLSSIGINIGPLLAGAGVAGIAIGFGAQALVRDVVSGIFFLLDDAFRVGEYIEMENLRGTVESMSLRSLRVRHHLGAVHTIPFGELKALTNYSRDWVIMKLEFRVPFDTDLKLVKKLVKQVGAELQAHEGYGQHLIQPLKSQGVRRMEEFNMVIGVKFMARPGAQWLIRRDAYQKLRDIFEKNGINFASRNVKVEIAGDQPLSDDVRRAVAGAAQEAVEKQDMPPEPVPDEP
ncbi:MAG: mechanosensitive ion channel family protein [Rhizobiaceae bacterium]